MFSWLHLAFPHINADFKFEMSYLMAFCNPTYQKKMSLFPSLDRKVELGQLSTVFDTVIQINFVSDVLLFIHIYITLPRSTTYQTSF